MESHLDQLERLQGERAALLDCERELERYGERLEKELRDVRERIRKMDEMLLGVASVFEVLAAASASADAS